MKRFNTTGKTGILILLIFLVVPVILQAITIKLASPFPERTKWDNSLRFMAEQFKKISNGQVTVRIYPGGVAGNDADMIRKMRFGQLDAGVMTSFGMKTIVPNSFVMSLPGILQKEEELDMLLDTVAPTFDSDFLAKGFKVLTWSKTGWAYFYSTTAIRTPEQLRNEKLAASSTDGEVIAHLKAMRFNVAPVDMSSMVVGLQSGRVTVFYAPPLVAASFQWFALAPNMIDLPIAPVLGALIISKRTWNRIPEKFHADLQEVIAEMSKEFTATSVESNREALKIMKENGLNFLEVNDSLKAEWFEVFKKGVSRVVGEGKSIDSEVYDSVIDKLEEFRNS